MATITPALTLKNTILTAIRDALDGGPSPGLIKIYSGTKPADAETAVTTQVLLATLTLSDPCGSVAAGILTFSPITSDSSADATGTATWARLETSSGAAVADVDVSNAAGNGFIRLNTVSIVAGGSVSITSAQIWA